MASQDGLVQAHACATSRMMVQALLLDAAANLVRAGGFLVYSTCSIEDDEGSTQITSFLQRHADFRAVPAQNICLPKAVVSPNGYIQIFQQRHGIEGAFAAILRRE